MKIGIFYLSLQDPPPAGCMGIVNQIVLPSGGQAFVRVEQVEAADLSDALSDAAPADGEMVMNTHPLEPTGD